jgi:hypothetical protein
MSDDEASDVDVESDAGVEQDEESSEESEDTSSDTGSDRSSDIGSDFGTESSEVGSDIGDALGDLPQENEDEDTASTDSIIHISIVPDDQRITSDRLYLNELVGVLNLRIKQLEAGAPCYAPGDLVKDVTDARELAYIEYRAQCCPFILEREIAEIDGRRIVERWDVNKMIAPSMANLH